MKRKKVDSEINKVERNVIEIEMTKTFKLFKSLFLQSKVDKVTSKESKNPNRYESRRKSLHFEF